MGFSGETYYASIKHIHCRIFCSENSLRQMKEYQQTITDYHKEIEHSIRSKKTAGTSMTWLNS